VVADIEQARADLVGRGVEVRAIGDVGEESSTHGSLANEIGQDGDGEDAGGDEMFVVAYATQLVETAMFGGRWQRA
jgi:hypothetical protein